MNARSVFVGLALTMMISAVACAADDMAILRDNIVNQLIASEPTPTAVNLVSIGKGRRSFFGS